MTPIEINLTRPAERIQFSKELYDSNPSGYTVEDRLGRPVRVLCTDCLHEHLVVACDYIGIADNYSESGQYYTNYESQYDLFLRPVAGKSVEGWYNLYSDGRITGPYKCETTSNYAAQPHRTALIHIVQ